MGGDAGEERGREVGPALRRAQNPWTLKLSCLQPGHKGGRGTEDTPPAVVAARIMNGCTAISGAAAGTGKTVLESLQQPSPEGNTDHRPQRENGIRGPTGIAAKGLVAPVWNASVRSPWPDEITSHLPSVGPST